MNSTNRFFSILVLLAACSEESKPGAPPVGSASGSSTSTEGSGSTAELDCAEGERFLRWEDEFGNAAPTPSNVGAVYRLTDANDEIMEDVGCGTHAGIPTCWVSCGSPEALSLVVEWDCDTRVHAVSALPLPTILTFPGCVPTTGSSSETGSSSTETSSGSDDSGSSTGTSSSDSSGSDNSSSSSDSGTSSGA